MIKPTSPDSSTQSLMIEVGTKLIALNEHFCLIEGKEYTVVNDGGGLSVVFCEHNIAHYMFDGFTYAAGADDRPSGSR